MSSLTPSSAREAEDRGLLHALGGANEGVRGKIRLPGRVELRGDPGRSEHRGIINTTPNNVHLETTRAAAIAGKHVFLDKPIANTVGEGPRHLGGL